jgi:IrrE N-terminal-like domain
MRQCLCEFHRCPIGSYGETMTTRQIHKKCQALVGRLALPRPFSVDAMVSELAQQRGRPIELRTLPSGTMTNACGLWISTDARDEIYVEEKTTPFHREHIILHELGHMLCDHESAEADEPSPLARFLPDLSPDLIRRLLGRTNYTTEQEQEAELVASLIRTAAGTLTAPPSTGVRGNLETALGIRE